MTDAEKMILADAVECSIESTRQVKKWKRISAVIFVIALISFIVKV